MTSLHFQDQLVIRLSERHQNSQGGKVHEQGVE